jgi:O-antigen ligase
MSQSRGAWFYAAGVMAFIVWLHLYRRLALSESRMLILFTVLCIALVLICAVAYFAEIAEIIGKDATMSGRFRIYEEVLKAIQKKPFLGYGLGGFWFPGSLESQRLALSIGWANIGYSENGILELALQVGIVGVAMVLGMIGRAAWQGFRLLRTPFYSDRIGWYLSILVLAMLTNVDAGWFLTSDTLDWVLIVIACVGLNEEWHAASWHAEAARSQSAGWQIARVGAAEAASGGARA